jgi:hypothetical protein
LLSAAFNNGDLVRRQVVEFIDETVYLAVESGAFAFIEVSLRSRCGELLLGFEYSSRVSRSTRRKTSSVSSAVGQRDAFADFVVAI